MNGGIIGGGCGGRGIRSVNDVFEKQQAETWIPKNNLIVRGDFSRYFNSDGGRMLQIISPAVSSFSFVTLFRSSVEAAQNVFVKSKATGVLPGFGLLLRATQPYFKLWVFDSALKSNTADTPTILDGNWHLLSGSVTSGSWLCRMDGETLFELSTAYGNISNTYPLAIGGDNNNGAPADMMEGNIGPTCLWNRVMDLSELQKIENIGKLFLESSIASS